MEYYIQQVVKLMDENSRLHSENERLKAENAQLVKGTPPKEGATIRALRAQLEERVCVANRLADFVADVQNALNEATNRAIFTGKD